MEIELKYRTDSETAEKIFSELGAASTDDIRIIPMEARYLDTKDGDLRERHITYRLRKEGGVTVLTVKYGKGSDKARGGLHRREEINIPVPDDFAEKPGIDVLEDTPIYKELDKAVGGQYSDELGIMLPLKPLIPVIEMRFVRKETEVCLNEEGTGRAVLSYDEGVIIAGNKKSPFSELEIELSEGNEDDLIGFGAKLSEKYGLQEGNKSKFARGLKLLEE
ncbi:MAG: CYTH domain-containing protein [Firmicutes bacterium]|nr:CYTH domain-containing protein [Bacillota bacterium]